MATKQLESNFRRAVSRTLMKLQPAICAGIVLFVLLSCGFPKRYTKEDYIRTVQSGIETMAWPKEIEELFGDSDHFITHFGFSEEPRTWNTVAYFGGRYVLTMQVKVEIHYKDNRVVEASEPTFSIREIESITPSGSGMDISYSGQWRIDEEQWDRFVAFEGDWTSISIPVETNTAVDRFEEFVRRERARQLHIPH